jgi:hypothetical protein
MHAIAPANYVSTHPDSTLAQFAGHAITYDNDSTSTPSDSFPGLGGINANVDSLPEKASLTKTGDAFCLHPTMDR